jgi:thiol-disulfide isomerase/thioredoxin
MVAGAIHFFSCPCQAADEPKPNVPAGADTQTTGDVSDALRSLRREVDNVGAARAAYAKASGVDEEEKLWAVYYHTNDAVIPKIIDGVRLNPTSPLAFELLEWVATNARISAVTLRPYRSQAVEMLRDHHATHTNLSGICRSLGAFGDPLDQPSVEFLQIVSAKNPERAGRGFATFSLARLAKDKSEEMAYCKIAPAPTTTNSFFLKRRAAWLEELKIRDPDAVLHQAEQLFQTVLTNYADVPYFPPGSGGDQSKSTLGEKATLELYECQHLTVGKVAPDIQGEDLDGHKLKLSDYRGKVVMISFWASWCGPCMQMVPDERALAERVKGKPFVLVGVNGDSKKADAIRAVTDAKITWPSFWNGVGGSNGDIADAWNVRGWPTVFVLDSKGIIRLKTVGHPGKALDTVVDQLVEEARAEGELKM